MQEFLYLFFKFAVIVHFSQNDYYTKSKHSRGDELDEIRPRMKCVQVMTAIIG